MNLEEALNKASFIMVVKTGEKIEEAYEPIVRREDAIRIAREYAEKMCKTQRILCCNSFDRQLNKLSEFEILHKILHCDLATEEK